MAQPSAELADLIKAARARGYQIVRTNDGNGWLVTTGALKGGPNSRAVGGSRPMPTWIAFDADPAHEGWNRLSAGDAQPRA